MRAGAAGAVVVLGFVLACGGAEQTEAEALQLLCDGVATCSTCPGVEEDGFEAALVDHVRPTITHPASVSVLDALATSAVHEAAPMWREVSRGKVTTCALTPILDKRLETFHAVEIARLCALHTSCETFDGTDPASVLACADEQLAPSVAAEVRRMDTRSSIGLAKSLDAYSSKHTTAGCALSIVLRDAR